VSQTWCDECEKDLKPDEKHYRIFRGSDLIVCKDCAEMIDNYDPTPYCIHCGPKSNCDCPPHPAND